jgi:hypothetical protein
VQHVKIFLPCNFEVNPITHFGVIVYVNDSQNLAFPTSHFVIELVPFDYLSNQKQWVNKKMHFKRNNSLQLSHIFNCGKFFVDLDKLSSFIDWCCYYTQVSYTGSWEPLVFLIILNIWIYYTISFCRFTFCFYILMAKQTNRRKRFIKTILLRSIDLFLFFLRIHGIVPMSVLFFT